MIIYNYDELTKEFLYSETALKNPLEEGKYLIPKNATTLALPKFHEDETVKFIDNAWLVSKKESKAKEEAKQKTLNDLKDIKLAEIGYEKSRKQMEEAVSFKSDFFGIDDTSLNYLNSKAIMANLDKTKTFIFRSKTNQIHMLLSDEIISLALMVSEKIDEIYQKSWELKALVEVAQTAEDLEKIVWK
ncbi:MAG: hypothetical protein BWY78_00799 [Alphaproteobacteria bacterium ADurb.Bin438]|nr:MAG: hypothetical protein BWY78_00799 [Alphaproteobacteria bacterium ADurb.Bin438]